MRREYEVYLWDLGSGLWFDDMVCDESLGARRENSLLFVVGFCSALRCSAVILHVRDGIISRGTCLVFMTFPDKTKC